MKKKIIVVLMISCMLCISGCGTTELEERCFPQLVTVGYEDDKVTYYAGFPKVEGADGKSATSSEIQVSTVTGASFEDSRKKFEQHLNKLADYNHLKVLVLEEDFMEEKAAYDGMLEYLAGQEDYPRNTYVCAVDDAEDLLEIDSSYTSVEGILFEPPLGPFMAGPRKVVLNEGLEQVDYETLKSYVDLAGLFF